MQVHVDNTNVSIPQEVLSSLQKVSHKLSSFRKSDFVDSSLFKPSVTLLSRRSKLLRPMLVLMGAYAVGDDSAKFIDLAAAAELLHTASLIHDDIIDEDRMRRGALAVHEKYGNHVAILAGDALISKAVGMAAKYGEDVLKSITQASMEMCAGEVMDHYYKGRKAIPMMDDYVKIASLKSASLIGACCSAAAVYNCDASSSQIYNSGKEVGIAFQIRDDIMDFISAMKNRDENELAPNIVTSIRKDYGLDTYDAVMMAVETNNRYIDSSKKRVEKLKFGRLLSGYVDLIRVRV